MEEKDFSELNKDSFKVPIGYFEGIEEKILGRLHPATSESGIINIDRNQNSRSIWRRISLVAASVAACAAFIIYYNKEAGVNEFNLSKLDNTEIINYLNENADEVELDLLVERSNTGSNAFELTDTEYKGINQDELIDDVNIEELF